MELTRNFELRAKARQALTDNWGMSAVMTLVYMAISGCLSIIPFIGWVAALLVSLPLAWGFMVAFLKVYRGGKPDVADVFDGFKDFGRIFGTILLMHVYIFLWSLLLLIPGIIKQYSYAMTYFILKDEPELSMNAAIEKSMAMMSGHKAKLFGLDLSFIGWAILALITCGIGFFWLYPYVYTSRAAFYEDLKKQQ